MSSALQPYQKTTWALLAKVAVAGSVAAIVVVTAVACYRGHAITPNVLLAMYLISLLRDVAVAVCRIYDSRVCVSTIF